MNILQAIQDPNLFRPFLADDEDDLTSWQNWMVALRVLYGLPLNTHRKIVEQCTGRTHLPGHGFDTALFLTGRRSGKSRIASIIGAFEATLAGHETKLAKGERGIVPIVSPTRHQSRVIKDYMRAIFDSPLLANEIAVETREGFELNSGTRIEILAGDWRTVRNFTCLAVIVDEAAFFGYTEESKVKSDTELIRAIKPSLATVGGRLIGISSPYARKGWTWTQHKRNFGNDVGKTLVWNCPSRTMNPTLPQAVVDEAMDEDLQAAKSEYLGEFRDDVAVFLPREVIENLVAEGRGNLLPRRDISYSAFVDMSGGRGDDAALAIAHKRERTVVVDLLRQYRPPFNPYQVVSDMVEELERYGIRNVTGDNYAADFAAQAFRSCGIGYKRSEKPKSALYLELLPRLCSGEIKLPDNETLVNQLANLERRTRSGGKDVIDHPPGGHDDVANAVAGVCNAFNHKKISIGAFFAPSDPPTQEQYGPPGWDDAMRIAGRRPTALCRGILRC